MKLSINIDHVATLRNARGGAEPDPAAGARIVERAGADGIVCHLREDRRHIRDEDVWRLRTSIATKLDLEMAATPEIVRIALRLEPEGNPDDFRGRRHFQIEFRGNGCPEAPNVFVPDVPPVLPEMTHDPVRTRTLNNSRSGCRIGLGAAPGVAQRRYVVDVNRELHLRASSG